MYLKMLLHHSIFPRHPHVTGNEFKERRHTPSAKLSFYLRSQSVSLQRPPIWETQTLIGTMNLGDQQCPLDKSSGESPCRGLRYSSGIERWGRGWCCFANPYSHTTAPLPDIGLRIGALLHVPFPCEAKSGTISIASSPLTVRINSDNDLLKRS